MRISGKKRFSLFVVVGIVLILLNGGVASVTAEEVALTLNGPDGIEQHTIGEVKGLPTVEGWGGMKDSVGQISGPFQYRGVSVKTLAGQVGELDEGSAVRVVARDGYAMTFSYAQVEKGDFLTYDPASGDEIDASGLELILAYEEGGEPLPEKHGGPLRAVVVGPKNQVTDGHWWVKWVETVEVVQLKKDWTLNLDGELTVEIDRSTFESGTAPSCHQASWTDEEGNKWTGIPLWLLVGYVDDEVKHQGQAFNDGLAEKGYEVNVVASDGYSRTFDSSRVAGKDEIIVANEMNGEVLTEDDWPLRLVGPNLKGYESVSKLAKIEILFE